jgi:hypothetical protein
VFKLIVLNADVFVFPIINLHSISSSSPLVQSYSSYSLYASVISLQDSARSAAFLPRFRAPHFRYFSLNRLNPQSSDSHHRDYNGVSSVPQPRTDRLIAIWAHSKFWIALAVTLSFVGFFVYRDQPFRESKAFEYS